MELRYRKGPLRFCEIWFNEMPTNGDWRDRYGDVDVILFYESRVPVSSCSVPFRNGVLALDTPLDPLIAKFNSGFRNEVRRAGKEGILVGKCKAVDSLAEIYQEYAQFCRRKQINAISQSALRRYASDGHLLISKAELDKVPVQAHLYIADSYEAVLLASFPLSVDWPGKVTGWANRALHFSDIVQFKDAGLRRYNLGGMGNPVTDINRAIVSFKNEMSPTIVNYYQDEVAVSHRGSAYSLVKKLIK